MRSGTSPGYGVLAPPKRLSYGNAKKVLHYLDAYKRISLVTKYPKQFENKFATVGYRISCLKFEENMIQIDQKIFSRDKPSVNMQRLGKVLGGGNGVHYVDCLSVSNMKSIRNFPKDLKITAGKMVLRDDTIPVFTLLRSTIVTINKPLEKILIYPDSPLDQIFANTITSKDTKVLALILPVPTTGVGQWAQPLINLSHPNIELNESKITVIDLIRIAIDWIRNPRPIGHQIGFVTNEYFGYLQGVFDHLKTVRVFCKRTQFFPFGFCLPVNANSEILIHIVKSPYYEKELHLHDRILGMMVMEVVEKGTDDRFFM